MDIISYLVSKGFKPVRQIDNCGKFIDYEYLNLNDLYAELHDDNMFYLWTDPYNPLISLQITPETIQYAIQLSAYLINKQ